MPNIVDPVLGARTPVGRDGVRIDASTPGRLRLVAERDLSGLATGRFASPSAGVGWSAANWATDIEFLGAAFTQFALPVTAGRELDFDFHPSPDLRSPRAVSPLIARSGDSVVMLAPIDGHHEQVVAVARDGLTWGWHGDLDTVPAGFATTLGIYVAATVADALAAWGADVRAAAGPVRHADDAVTTHLSYWTDNGAAYWYRTEVGATIAGSVAAAVGQLRDDGVPIRSVELDSWFYEHATPRPIAEIGYPEAVPPTGAMRWSARADAFPPPAPPADDAGGVDPIAAFQARLDAPLVVHARHISPDSPYVTDPDEWWTDDAAAHPRDPEFFRQWFDAAVGWGATCIEQDWMLMSWFGVRGLRAGAGRAAAWQRALNDHARATGIGLIWCMATPADLMLAASLDRVVAVRTCDDYRFADDPAFLWTWFLTVNRLTNELGLRAFKDCFFSRADGVEGNDGIDGDQHAEFEALLAALSGGPVGIGDRIGRTDRDVVLRTCDDDGRLRRVDRALAATDDCLFGGPARGSGLMWATTTATTTATTGSTTGDSDVWTYVVAINTASSQSSIADRFVLPGERSVYEWRTGVTERCSALEVELTARDWALWIVAPPGGGDIDRAGDRSKYVVVESAID